MQKSLGDGKLSTPDWFAAEYERMGMNATTKEQYGNLL